MLKPFNFVLNIRSPLSMSMNTTSTVRRLLTTISILTISKLDSNLLLIAPMPVQPVEIIRQALQMFMVECQKLHDIDLKFNIGASFKDLKVGMVMLDPSRLLQVLINLMTNAIKFTKTSAIRTIKVSIEAGVEPPAEQDPSFQYFPTKKAKADVTSGSEWGDGEILYLRFEVNHPQPISALANHFPGPRQRMRPNCRRKSQALQPLLPSLPPHTRSIRRLRTWPLHLAPTDRTARRRDRRSVQSGGWLYIRVLRKSAESG